MIKRSNKTCSRAGTLIQSTRAYQSILVNCTYISSLIFLALNAMSSHVSILLLGSGWTSQFLLPLLKTSSIPYAYTKRSPSSSDAGAIPFEAAKEGEQQDASAFQSLPRADMVVIIFPLTSKSMVDGIVGTYEEVKECQPAWLALGSTSAWSKGFSTSSTPILETNTRAMAESSLLSLDNKRRRTAVLNLSGLYGGNRDPSNFAKKVGDTMEKLEGKTSLHLVHGKDVALAIIGMWEALKIPTRRDVVWGKRWIVTGETILDRLTCQVAN